MDGFCIPAPVRKAIRTLLPAEIRFGTVTVTALEDGLVVTAEASVQLLGIPAALATRTFVTDMLVGIKVLDGKVSVTVPDPAARALATVKSTVSVAVAFTIASSILALTAVTGPTFDIV